MTMMKMKKWDIIIKTNNKKVEFMQLVKIIKQWISKVYYYRGRSII